MFCAVKDRLRLAVGAAMTVPLNGSAAPVRATVLDCVDALDQLHLALTPVRAGTAHIDAGRSDADGHRAAEADSRAAPAP